MQEEAQAEKEKYAACQDEIEAEEKQGAGCGACECT